MKLIANKSCDVFVVGAGIAGSIAAIHAAENGADTIIASAVQIFAGSSFYPGTWGLGLIGPENEEDEKGLCETIARVGSSMTISSLVESFVKNIRPAIEELEMMGVHLRVPENPNDSAFVPCFDHKNRFWRGIEQESLKETFRRKFEELDIETFDHFEVVDIIKEKDKVVGVIGINKDHEFELIQCSSLIIASGGIGSLFKNHLNSEDVSGIMHSLAIKAGCICTNLEFMQIMPGFINPGYKTVFNEKTFKYANFMNEEGMSLLKDVDEILLNERSTYGPFTSRLVSSKIDYLLALQQSKGKILCHYDSSLNNTQNEFIQVYFNWLKEKKHIVIDDSIEIGLFYHAANGGIKINEKAETNVSGIYAAGEVSGGMHGADRIGGLASANALVFGRIAGDQAAQYSKNIQRNKQIEVDYKNEVYHNAKKQWMELQEMMNQCAMIDKNIERCYQTRSRIQEIEENLVIDHKSKEIHTSIRLKENCFLAKALLEAIILRKESRGSFYRRDYPKVNEEFKRIEISYSQKLNVRFIK